jgi:hypothetical protein
MGVDDQLVERSRRSICALVDLLRDRGALYVGAPTIECLAAFISGWLWALGDHAVDQEVWDHFVDFVASVYGDEDHRSWDALIEFHSPHTCEAYENFFRLFDQSVEHLKASSGVRAG